jgi:hypothetical protein
MLQLDGIPEADAAWFIQQLVCAVEFCHRLGVANRDIKVLPTAADGWWHCAPCTCCQPNESSQVAWHNGHSEMAKPHSSWLGVAGRDIGVLGPPQIRFEVRPMCWPEMGTSAVWCAAAGQHAAAQRRAAPDAAHLRLRLLKGRAGAVGVQVHLR